MCCGILANTVILLYGGYCVCVHCIQGGVIFWDSSFSRVGHPFFSKERNILAFFPILYKRKESFLHSFPFFIKEQNDLCVLFRSLKKNVPIFAFFSVLYERTFRSLRSFPCFIKDRNVLFGFISHTNIANLAKKEHKKTIPFFLKNVPFFF